MNNKTWLVSRREVIENIRTKGFWVGVLLMPLILIVSFSLPNWLQKQKEVRKYVVVDESGWLLPAVEERASMPDVEKVLRQAIEDKHDDAEEFEKLPADLKTYVSQLDAMWEHASMQPDESLPESEREHDRKQKRDYTIRAMATLISDPQEFENQLPLQSLKDELRKVAEKVAPLRESIKRWWDERTPEEAARYAEDTTKARFQRIAVEAPGGDLIETLSEKVAKGDLFAYFVIGKDPVNAGDRIRYASSNLTDSALVDRFMRDVNAVVRDRRLDEKDIDKLTAQWVQKPVDLDSRKIGKDGKEEKVETKDKIRQFAPMGFAYLLWIAVFSITQMLLTNTIEEKSSRIIEVLLSSISPLQLMMGKIFGIAITGLLMVGSWALSLIAVFRFLPEGTLPFPKDVGAILSDPILLGCFVAYFALGYMFYAALLVAIGAACNTLKEAQNLMGPISIVMMLPLMAIFFLTQDPNGRLAVIMSFIPPFTPFVMMNRAAADIPLWQFIGTTALLLASIGIVMYCAAKIFRIGILMSGSAPSLKDLIQWIKAPVGQLPEAKQVK